MIFSCWKVTVDKNNFTKNVAAKNKGILYACPIVTPTLSRLETLISPYNCVYNNHDFDLQNKETCLLQLECRSYFADVLTANKPLFVDKDFCRNAHL